MPSVINSDNGVISGTSGLKTSASNDGLLDLQSNGTRIAGITTSAFQVGADNISAVNSLGFRNRIINGDMRIDQRNAGASVTPTTSATAFPVDRFGVSVSQNSKLTVQQNAGSVTPPVGFSNYLGVTSSSAYSILTGDYFFLRQRVEGFNTSDLAWGTANAATVTLSFWVRSSLTGTFGGTVINSPETYGYPFTYTISAANTWEQKTITIVGPTGGTWVGSTNGIGLAVLFGLGVGSTSSNSAGSFQTNASGVYGATGATSVVGTNGATFYITGVQLEAGSVATPFERRDYGRELMMCQRYYCKTFATATAPAQNTGSSAGAIGFISQAAQLWDAMWRFPVEMRTTPGTVTTYSPNQANANWSLNGDAPTASTLLTGATGVAIRATTPAAGGRSYAIHASADAEL